MRSRTAILFLSLMASMISVSCEKETNLPSLDDYNIEVNVFDGTVRDGIILTYPYALVSFSGPDGNGEGAIAESSFIVKDSGSGETFSVTQEINGTGTTIVQLKGTQMTSTRRYYARATVVRLADRAVLHERNDLSVVFQSKDIAIQEAFLLLADGRQPLVEGTSFTMKEGEKGSIQFRMAGDEQFESLSLSSTPHGLVRIGDPSEESLKENVFLASIEAVSAGDGILTFCATVSGRNHNYIFSYTITPSTVPPGPDPSGDKAIFSLSAPSVAFAGKEASFRLWRESGDAEQNYYDVAFFLDGKPCYSSVRTAGNSSTEKKLHEWISFEGDVSMVIGRSEPIGKGEHMLTARLRPSGSSVDFEATEGEYSQSSVPFTVYGFSFKWESIYQDRGTVLEGIRLISSKAAAEYRLNVEYGCNPSLLSGIIVKESNSGQTLREQQSLSTYLLSHQNRGMHRFDICVRTAASEEYLFTTEARCEDEYGCAVKCDGSTISAFVSGPSQVSEANVAYHIDGGIIAVVPYTEAIELGGGYYEIGKYEYTDLQWVEKSFEQKKGAPFGEQVLQSGWIQAAMSWSKSKLSGISVTPGKASRWKNQGGKMVKEYYNPKPYLLVKLYITSTVTQATLGDYIVISYDFENIKSYLESNDVELLVYRN